MNIQFTARHFHASSELQESVHEQVLKLEKYYHNITDAFIVLDADKERLRRVELKMNIYDKTVSAKAEESNMHKALDAVFTKMSRQLKRENQKLKNHRSPSLAETVQ